ncbi:hypothetical protein B7494_g6508 [Chlorociboria aeruginascens]|nr:hypothetical protein B7494_g6508 [Chlorociboria aeruginascens]
MATDFAMPVQQFTASPSQYALYNSQSQNQQISPINSASGTPNTSSPTSPRGPSHLPAHTRQLRPPKSPLYVPAVLRPTDPPKRVARPSPLTPPQSMHNSLEDLGNATLSRRSTDDSGKFGLGVISESEWSTEGLGKVTALPTRQHWKPDYESQVCDETTCTRYFAYFTRRHHCRRCGNIFCDNHSMYSIPLDQDANYHPQGTQSRACEHCWHDFRSWQITRCSRTNSQNSEDTPKTPVVICKPRNVFGAKNQGMPESLGASVPRDWYWKPTIVRTAGGRVCSALSTLLVLALVGNGGERGCVIIVHHTDCGLQTVVEGDIRAGVVGKARGGEREMLERMEFGAFVDPEVSVREDGTHRQDSRISDPRALLPLKNPLHQALFDPHHLHTILSILFISQHQQRDAFRFRMLQYVFEHQPAFLQAPSATARVALTIRRQRPVADIRAVDNEHYRVARGVIHVWQRDGGYVLANCGHGFRLGDGVRGQEERFYLFVEGGLARIVEPEEEDGKRNTQTNEWVSTWMKTYTLTVLSKSTSTRNLSVGGYPVERGDMAPVEIHTPPSLLPTGVVASHIFLVGYLSIIVSRTIYRSYLALPPSSATRHRQPLRRGHVQAFSALAVVSLMLATYFGVQFSGLSYRVWATERGVELPDSVFGDKGAFRGGEHPGRVHLFRWLNDTPFYQDSLEIVTEKARYFWWGQQINLGTVSWSIYLAIEGQRRKISNLWAFMLLSQLVGLSYAQNLFFVAVLLTPVPLPENVREITRSSVLGTSSTYSHIVERIVPVKPEGWMPKPALYIILLFLNFGTIFLIPFASNTPSFMTVTLLAKVLPLTPLLLPYLVPESWGTIHEHPHSAHNTYITLFRTISVISASLHLKSTVLALFYNTPESHYYRHSLLHPFKEEHRSGFNRASVAIGTLFGSVREHPAVSGAGSDVILSGLSLGVWATIRGLDTKQILGLSMVFMKRVEKEVEEDVASVKEESVKAIQNSSTPARRRAGRPRKSETDVTYDAPRRLRSKKDDDPAYQPIGAQLQEGDEDVEDDWEIGALAWGAITTGGLGNGSAGIFAAEVLAR